MEQTMAAQQSKYESQMVSASVGDTNRMKDLLSPRLPFGLPSGKMTMSGPY